MSSSRFRIAVGTLLSVIALERATLAQDVAKVQSPKASRSGAEPKEITLSVTRKDAPTPIFRYRFLPTTPELTPGDAAPIYLRLGYGLPDGDLQGTDLKVGAWLEQPIDSFPTSEAKLAVDRWFLQLQQIEFGTRRQTCDWNYTALEEKDNPFDIRLTDAHTMRVWGRLLALKAKVEIASGHPEDAIRTLAAGMAFGRHVGERSFYINTLIGVSIVNQLLDRVDELIGRPDAPNLYWALTALPQPLISTREATENEYASVGRALTGRMLNDPELNQPRSDAEWTATLGQLYARVVRLEQLLKSNHDSLYGASGDLETFKATLLPKAQDYVKTRRIPTTSDDQRLVLTLIGLYRELADEYFQSAYIPHPDATAREAEVAKRVEASKSGPASVLGQILPAIQAVHKSEARLDRKIAALRVVEAVRLYAANHDGGLPESLDQIKTVPIPNDPFTGKPFEYRRDGESAVLTGQSSSGAFRLIYRLTVRK